MIVKIDEREKKSRIESAEKFFRKQGHVVIRETLVIGDYLFDDKICFEYKSAKDMIESIKDGRVFKQARNMKQYEHSFVIVVGSVPVEVNKQNKYKSQKFFTVKAWLGAFARLETYTSVLIVENNQQAWQLMESLVSKILKDNVDIKSVDRPQRGLSNPIASYLSCIYINDSQRLRVKSALAIVDYLEDNGMGLLDLTKDNLLEINGIADKTAEAILDAIGDLK